jgi:prepilin-type processing-associated H-X9-DG protein
VGLALTQYEKMIAMDVVSSDGTSEAFSNALLLSVSASFERARYQSAKLVSTSNVKGLLISCKIYANDHQHQWPPNLKVLVQDGSILPKMLESPYDHDKGQGGGSYYLYRRIDETAVKSPSFEVAISEPAIHDGGAVFGFVDGHAEWVESPRADELLAIMRSGR